MPQTRQFSPFRVRSGHASTSNMSIIPRVKGVVKGEIGGFAPFPTLVSPKKLWHNSGRNRKEA